MIPWTATEVAIVASVVSATPLMPDCGSPRCITKAERDKSRSKKPLLLLFLVIRPAAIFTALAKTPLKGG